MWVRYTSLVSFVALAIAYGATLIVGWSLARSVPGVPTQEQTTLLVHSLAVTLIVWPIWFVHWRWAKRDWNWDTTGPQMYLAVFTIVGLIASAVVGVQFVIRLLEVMVGVKRLDNDSVTFLIGALWSTLFSLLVWVYHGAIWLRHRRRMPRVGQPAPR